MAERERDLGWGLTAAVAAAILGYGLLSVTFPQVALGLGIAVVAAGGLWGLKADLPRVPAEERGGRPRVAAGAAEDALLAGGSEAADAEVRPERPAAAQELTQPRQD